MFHALYSGVLETLFWSSLTICMRVLNSKPSVSTMKGGFQLGGGTILQMPKRSASGRILAMNSSGFRHCSSVG